jgi:DNA-binding HxlR family transcriptional regulator
LYLILSYLTQRCDLVKILRCPSAEVAPPRWELAAQQIHHAAVCMHSAEPAAIAALSLASFALLLLARRRRAPKRFAGFDESVPESTRQALEKHRWLPLRHTILKRKLSPAMLEGLFDEIVRTFTPQQVDYSNTAYGKDHWQLSCFMEYCAPRCRTAACIASQLT